MNDSTTATYFFVTDQRATNLTRPLPTPRKSVSNTATVRYSWRVAKPSR